MQNNTSLNVINTKTDILEAKKKYQVYYSSDTHCNDIGAFAITQAALRSITGQKDFTVCIWNLLIPNESSDLE